MLMSGKLEDAECSACPFYDTHRQLQVVGGAQEPFLWLVPGYPVAVLP